MGSARLIAWGALCLLGACAAPKHNWAPYVARNEQWHPAAALIARYDSDNDGNVTRRELEAGIRQDFRQADANGDGRLDADEVRAVNQRRIKIDQSMATPLMDWNQDGYVDFQEFAAPIRSLFDQLDANGDGVVSLAEFKAAITRVPVLQPAG